MSKDNCKPKVKYPCTDADKILYTGVDLPCSEVDTSDTINQALIKIDAKLCDLSDCCANNSTITTDDTVTLDLTGDGSPENPLYGDVNVSGAPNNAIMILGDGLFAANTIESGVIYGGIVTWLQDYDYHVSAAGYYINGVFYTSPEAYITLSPADLVDDRLDTFIVDINGVASVLEGTPDPSPSQAPLDPATQLELSITLVQANTTEPGISTECVYLENVEWLSSSTSAVRLNPNSTANPATGAKSIEGTGVVNNDYVLFTRGSAFSPIPTYTILTFNLRSKATWGNNRKLLLAFELNAVPVGVPVTIKEGSFGFDSSNNSTYQVISIPLITFGLNSTSSIDQLKITAQMPNGTLGFYIDDICFQDADLPPSIIDLDEKVKVSSNDTTPGYLSTKLVAGTNIVLTEINDGGNETYEISAFIGDSARFAVATEDDTANEMRLFNWAGYNFTFENAPNYFRLLDDAGFGNPQFESYFEQVGGEYAMYTEAYNSLYAEQSDAADLFQYYEMATGGLSSTASDEWDLTSAEAHVNVYYGVGAYGEQPDTGVIDFLTEDATESTYTRAHFGFGTGLHSSGFFSPGIYLQTRSSNVGTWKGIYIDTAGDLRFHNYPYSRDDGSDTKFITVDADGDVVLKDVDFSAASVVLTADNGLTKDTPTNVQLGGTLIQNTTIDATSAFNLTITGSITPNTSGVLVVENSNATATSSVGIRTSVASSSSSSYGIISNATAGVAIRGIATTGNGGAFTSTSGFGITAATNSGTGAQVTSTNGISGWFITSPSATNTITEVLRLERNTSGTAATGIGGYLSFAMPTSANIIATEAARIQSSWTDATSLSQTGSLEFLTTNNASAAGLAMTIHGDKRVVLTGRLETDKGANVAAANDLTLGTDGNVFTITGNTQTNAINTTGWQSGSFIILEFTGTPTLKHNTAGGAGTAPLFLAGSVDFVAAANDSLILYYNGTHWHEVSRKTASTGTSLIFRNGLTESPAGIIELGGTLLHDTTIDAGATYALIINGTNTDGTLSEGALKVNNTLNTASLTTAINASVTGTNASSVAIVGLGNGATCGVSGQSTGTGIGVLGTTSSGNALEGRSTSGIGCHGFSNNGLGVLAATFPSSTNTIVETLRVSRSSTGSAAAGIGAAITFSLEDSSTQGNESARIASTWTDVTTGTRTGDLKFYTTNSASSTQKLGISGAGIFTITQGLQNFADDAAASAGGIPVNGLYRNGSIVMIRVS